MTLQEKLKLSFRGQKVCCGNALSDSEPSNLYSIVKFAYATPHRKDLALMAASEINESENLLKVLEG